MSYVGILYEITMIPLINSRIVGSKVIADYHQHCILYTVV